ncbi:MAG: porphobilinogen synthase [Pseudomonadota bacterium]
MSVQAKFPQVRLRRLRQTQTFRNLVADVEINPNNMILPLFIHAGKNIKQPISSMPGHFQWSIDKLNTVIDEIKAYNIAGIMLFGIPDDKDESGAVAISETGVIQQAIKYIKDALPELIIVADCCFCEYLTHGHCGIVIDAQNQKKVDNDKTLSILGQQAVSLAQAGADIIAPSGMMDGMVAQIRNDLDTHNFADIPIMSYAVKYASGLYGPFREAAEGAPQFGDRKTYQMDYRREHEAVLEVDLDINEGADIIIVKPASYYLDIIYKLKQHIKVPLCAYQVSGEYSMIKAAAAAGWLDEQQVMLESLYAIKRAGADFIITYFAKEISAFCD